MKKVLFIILFILGIITISNVYAFNWNDGTVISNYHFNEASYSGSIGEVKDSLGINNGTSNKTQVIAGYFGNGANFNTTNFIQDLGNKSAFSYIHSTGNFTISMWIKFNNYSDDTTRFIALTTASQTGLGFLLRYENVSGRRFNLLISNSTNLHPAINSLSMVDPITDNNWHSLIVSGNGTNINFYIDSVLNIGTGDIIGLKTGDSANNLSLGGVGNIINGGINGTIDELTFWNRSLSQNDIDLFFNYSYNSYPSGVYNEFSWNVSSFGVFNLSDSNFIIFNNTDGIYQQLNLFNITNSLIQYDNGTSIPIYGKQDINLTLIPNQFVYVWNNLTLDENNQVSGYPIAINILSDDSHVITYNLSSTSLDQVNISFISSKNNQPVNLTINYGQNIYQIIYNPVSGSSSPSWNVPSNLPIPKNETPVNNSIQNKTIFEVVNKKINDLGTAINEKAPEKVSSWNLSGWVWIGIFIGLFLIIGFIIWMLGGFR